MDEKNGIIGVKIPFDPNFICTNLFVNGLLFYL